MSIPGGQHNLALWHWPNLYMPVSSSCRRRLCPSLGSAAGLGNAESVGWGAQSCAGWMLGIPLAQIQWRTSVLVTGTVPFSHTSAKHRTNTSLLSPWPKPPPHCPPPTVSVTEKHLAMRSPNAGRGLSMGLPRSVLLLFLLLLVWWTVILFFQQPHCQLQWPGRSSDPE